MEYYSLFKLIFYITLNSLQRLQVIDGDPQLPGLFLPGPDLSQLLHRDPLGLGGLPLVLEGQIDLDLHPLSLGLLLVTEPLPGVWVAMHDQQDQSREEDARREDDSRGDEQERQLVHRLLRFRGVKGLLYPAVRIGKCP